MIQTNLFTEPAPMYLPPAKYARFTPRTYQGEAVDAAFSLFAQGMAGAMVRCPTGGGKTLIGAFTADRWLQQGEDYRVLVLAHERQLIKQFADEIKDYFGEKPAIEMGDIHCTGREKIIVASRATLYLDDVDGEKVSRLFKFDAKKHWLVIVDEAHRYTKSMKSCRHVFEHFEQNPNSRRLGLTATPERTDKITFAKLFPGVASDYRLFNMDGGPCAVEDGWAVRYDQRFITVEGVDFAGLREVAKDFDKHELEEVLGKQETLAKLIEPMLDLVKDRRTLVFSPGKQMAKDVALYINAKVGYEVAKSVDGDAPDDVRTDIYEQHQTGAIQFLSVCGLCREGYNDPGIQAVAIFRPTKSRSLAEQMKGRGCRPLRGIVKNEMTAEERKAAIAASDKPTCMIVDLVGITGMADCASTAHILAESYPDEVIDRANENMRGKTGPCDVAEEVRKADQELKDEEAERQRRIKEQEERAKARLERLARERKDKEEARRRAALDAQVKYTEHEVRHGGGGAIRHDPKGRELLTTKQANFLRWKKYDFDPNAMTKAAAMRIIGMFHQGKSLDEIKRLNRSTVKQEPREQPKPKPVNEPAQRKLPIEDANNALYEAAYSESDIPF